MAILRQPDWPKATVSVRYFAGAQVAAGLAEEHLTLAAPTGRPTLASLVDELVARHGPDLARVLAAASFIVDEVAAGPDRPLDDGARIDVLPPFAGG